MKVIWAKDKFQESDNEKSRKNSSKNTFTKIDMDQKMMAGENHQQEQATNKPCKFCGRERVQKKLKDSIEGNESYSYYQLLEECFGFDVPNPLYNICDQCAEMIENVYKFKDIVTTALESRTSESSSVENEDMAAMRRSEKEEQRRHQNNKRRKAGDLKQQKAIVVCSVCQQKYATMVTEGSDFVCSRCKINGTTDRTVACVKCQVVLPANVMKKHLEMHTNADLKGRCRLRSLPKKPSVVFTVESTPKKLQRAKKPQCRRCPKKITVAQGLNEHTRLCHGGYYVPFICSFCGKDMRSKDLLEKHYRMHEHAALFECHHCGKIFKQKSAFQRHELIHQHRLT